jgi:hypothetical protein
LAYLLKQQSRLLLIICRPRKTNFWFPFQFATNKQKFAAGLVFRLQQTNESCHFLLLPLSMYTVYTENGAIYIHAIISKGKQKMEAHPMFLNLFTVCSL